MSKSNGKAPVGQLVLIILKDDKAQRGIYEDADEHFVYLRTEQQTILLPHSQIIKIKVDNGKEHSGGGAVGT